MGLDDKCVLILGLLQSWELYLNISILESSLYFILFLRAFNLNTVKLNNNQCFHAIQTKHNYPVADSTTKLYDKYYDS